MVEPLVTILTPTHNCGKFIERTVDSVLKQTYENLEYWVIDDCSSDDTKVKLSQYAEKVNMVFNRENLGEQRTVNKLLNQVQGDYFMIVNADDPILPWAVEKLVRFMESQQSNILCAYPDWISIYENGDYKHRVTSREYDFAYMVRHHTCLPSVGAMFRSEVINKIGYRDTSFRWLGDFDYWLRIGLAGQMARLPATLATWRHRNGQLSGSRSKARAEEHIRIMQKFYSMSLPDYLSKLEGEAFCWAYLVAATVTDNKADTIQYIKRAIRSYPKMASKIEFWDVVRHRALHFLRR